MSCGRSPIDTPHFHEAQVLVVAAAGNSGDESWYDPIEHCKAHYDPVTTPDKLLVGSTTEGGALSYFSSYGACVHVQVLLPRRPKARRAAGERGCLLPSPPCRVA